MKKNIGTIDRVTQVVLALLIGFLYLAGIISGAVAIILGIIAVAFLISSLVDFCPVYLPFNLCTDEKGGLLLVMRPKKWSKMPK